MAQPSQDRVTAAARSVLTLGRSFICYVFERTMQASETTTQLNFDLYTTTNKQHVTIEEAITLVNQILNTPRRKELIQLFMAALATDATTDIQ
jgi:hypothetical protein